MMSVRELHSSSASDFRPLASPKPAVVPGSGLTAVISTRDGRCLSGGTVEIDRGLDGAWTAILRRLDRPGVIASLYFAEGVRDIVLKTPDGRCARARITGTSFLATGERVCSVVGLDLLP